MLSRYTLNYPNASIDIRSVWFHFIGVTFHWLYLSFELDQYSQQHNAVDHTAKLKSNSPWVSALVLSCDFWMIKQ